LQKEEETMTKKKLKTKLVAGLTAFAVLGTAAESPAMLQTAYAEEVALPTETNTSFSKARDLVFGVSMAGTFTESDNKRYYKFSLSQASRLDLGVERSRGLSYMYINIYDSSQTEIYSTWSTDGSFSLDPIYLTGGDYYMMISVDRDQTFSFVANMDSMGETFTETQDANNDMASNASPISLKKKYKGVLAQNDDIDYFKFNISSTGKITINLTNSTSYKAKYAIYDQSLNMAYTNTVGSNQKASQLIPLNKGSYYLAIAKEDVNKGTGSYTFSIDYTKKITAAPKIKSLKSPYSGQMTVKWNSVNGATGYEVWYSRKSNFKSGVTKKEYSSQTKSADYYGLTRGKRYYVRIRAYEEINGVRQYGKWSKKKSVAIKK